MESQDVSSGDHRLKDYLDHGREELSWVLKVEQMWVRGECIQGMVTVIKQEIEKIQEETLLQ